MDEKREIKGFINLMCEIVVYNFFTKGHENSIQTINNREAFILADKAIGKRIQKRLFKKYGFNSKVDYFFERYPVTRGQLQITIILK